MKILAEISDKTVGLGNSEKLGAEYHLRKSARVILENRDGDVALQHLTNYGFYKLPGGGVDGDETLEQAAQREVREEVGCDSKILSPIGVVIEYREKYQLLHISYCYVAQVSGVISEPAFEEAEVAAGQSNIWVKATTALELVQGGTKSNYESHFNIPREMAFLEEYLKLKNLLV